MLLRATPGDPTDAILGTRAPEAAKEALREELGLNAPLWVQYFKYLGQVLSFDLGSSLTSRGESVWQVIQQYFPATVELAFFCNLSCDRNWHDCRDYFFITSQYYLGFRR